jgi:hypothetical protein
VVANEQSSLSLTAFARLYSLQMSNPLRTTERVQTGMAFASLLQFGKGCTLCPSVSFLHNCSTFSPQNAVLKTGWFPDNLF